MKLGTKLVAEYAHAFKIICDQLHAIGRPVEDIDKVHWFFCGLGTDFSAFSTAQMALTPIPCFADLVSQTESFELFQRSLESSDFTPTTFTATNRGRTHGSHPASFSNQRGRSYFHKNNSSNRGRAHSGQGRRPPHYQICRKEGHYAFHCNQRYVRPNSTHAHLAEAFNTSCSIAGPNATDWFLDTGASTHMTTDPSILDQAKNYMGRLCDRRKWCISTHYHIGTLSPVPNIHLLDVLVSLISLKISFPLSITFTNNLLTI